MLRFFIIVILLTAGYMYYTYGGEDPKKEAGIKPVVQTIKLQ